MAPAWIPAALLALAAVGVLDALYFVLVTYGVARPDTKWVPRFCRMDEASCARVLDTRYARVLGLPNAVYGLAWYGVVVAAATLASLGEPLPCAPLLAGSAATILLSAYLAWALLARLRVPCPLCFLGHAVNATLLAALALACLTA